MAKQKKPRQIEKATAKKNVAKQKKPRQNKNLAAKWKIWRQNRKACADTVFGILSKNIL